MKNYLYIVGDTNDADYTAQLSELGSGDLEQIMPLIKAIKKVKGHNWYTQEYSSPRELYPQFTEEIFQLFEDCVPADIHTIKSIELIEVNKIKELL